jgi:NADH-quinone oxidoreductase subunit M
VPLMGAVALLFVPKERVEALRWTAVFFAAATFGLSLVALARFDATASGMQLVERAWWVKSLGIQYFMGVDGISLPIVVLSALLSLLAVIASWTITDRVRQYFVLLLLLEMGMIGVFCALDFVLFYVFWEVVLVPMYFLIGVWGGPRREYAAIKFFLYTLLGSVFMLVGMLALYFSEGAGTFDMLELTKLSLPLGFQMWVFAAFFLGFAVKVPIWPFHTWLPDAHVEAPTAVSVLLAGILLKMGSYGFMRVSWPMLPEAAKAWAPAIAVLAAISIVYGACVAMVQKDLKKLVAYSSVSHMGYIMLGIAAGTAVGMEGAVIQMFNHGTITGMLFLLVGLIYERAHTRQISELGGLSAQAPVLGGILAFASFASLGLPGLSGFVGELLVLLGAWTSPLSKAFPVIAALAIVITAGYLLWMLQRVVLGTVAPSLGGVPDVNARELTTLVPLMVIIVVVGVYPVWLLDYINPAATALAKALGAG